jgi:hypothetical protein
LVKVPQGVVEVIAEQIPLMELLMAVVAAVVERRGKLLMLTITQV